MNEAAPAHSLLSLSLTYPKLCQVTRGQTGPQSGPIIIIIITMAQQPYMGPGLLLPPVFEVNKSSAFVAVGVWSTGRASVLSILMCPPGDLGEKWRQFGLRNIFIHARKVLLHAVNVRKSPPKEVVLRIFITLKNPSTSVGIEPANLGSSGEHANH
jgi:hypothetical protein